MRKQRTVIGRILWDICYNNDITQNDIAAAIGISPSYLSMIAHRERRVPKKIVERLVEAYSLDYQTAQLLLQESYTYRNDSGQKEMQ